MSIKKPAGFKYQFVPHVGELEDKEFKGSSPLSFITWSTY